LLSKVYGKIRLNNNMFVLTDMIKNGKINYEGFFFNPFILNRRKTE